MKIVDTMKANCVNAPASTARAELMQAIQEGETLLRAEWPARSPLRVVPAVRRLRSAATAAQAFAELRDEVTRARRLVAALEATGDWCGTPRQSPTDTLPQIAPHIPKGARFCPVCGLG